ncbi:MAG: hypothetical protein HRT35_38565 [Algicola sp.]|nr:hypothetical protein [Algicola sp.]
MNSIVKKMMGPLVGLVALGFAGTTVAEECTTKWVDHPIAWDTVYNYKKSCDYANDFSGFIGSVYYSGAGANQITGPWTAQAGDYSCPAYAAVQMVVFGPSGQRRTWTDTGYFHGSSVNEKIVSRTPTDWVRREVWHCPLGGEPD